MQRTEAATGCFTKRVLAGGCGLCIENRSIDECATGCVKRDCARGKRHCARTSRPKRISSQGLRREHRYITSAAGNMQCTYAFDV